MRVFHIDQTVLLEHIKVDKRGRAADDKHRMCELTFTADQVSPEVMTELLGVSKASELAGLWGKKEERDVVLINLENIKIQPVSFEGEYEANIGGTNVKTVHKVHAFNQIKPQAGGTFRVTFKVQVFDPPDGFSDRCVDQKQETMTLRLEPLKLLDV